MKRVGVGVAGLGMGINHAQAYYEYDKAKLVALCDIRAVSLKQACDKFKAKPYLSYVEMLEDPEIEAVSIATPSYEHAIMGVMAALYGKHVLIEKPIATDLTAGDRLIQVCKEKGVKLGGIFQSRLDPKNIRIKQTLEEGTLGKPYLIEGIVKWWRGDKEYYHANKGVESWKGTWFGEGGGSMANQGVHTVDQLYWLMGEVESVYGHYATVGHSIQAEDFCVALIKFKNGTVGYIICTTSAPKDAQETRISVYGTRGVMSLVGDELTMKIEGEPSETIVGETLRKDTLTVPLGSTHTEQCINFIDAILEDREPAVTGESALKAIEIITAIYQSSMQGKPVSLPLRRY